jgi:CheY-like chemotaxis protein
VAKTILIVDDEEINLDMISSVLQGSGYAVFRAEDARTALNIVEEEKSNISAILMDLNMPKSDGFTAIKTLKGTKLFKSIPIMALTVSSDKESVLKAISSGADDYLTKPFDTDELLSRVSVLCKISDFIKRWELR